MKVSAVSVALLTGIIVACALHGVRAADDDPATAPQPNILDQLPDTRRAIYVEISLLTDGTTKLLDAGVTEVPPRADDDEPQMLLIEYLDATGEVIAARNAWDPRYQYQRLGNEEQVVLLDEGIGVFQVLFDYRIAKLRFVDQQPVPPQELAVFDVESVVSNFCNANPANENCDGFMAMDSDGDGITDDVDNCIEEPNADQSDLDGDGEGDVCDATPNGEKIPGDIDGDGVIDKRDYDRIRSALGQCEGQPGYIAEAEFTGDACVAYDDYQFWSSNYYATQSQPPGC
ncbi:MAG: thrombospondin type 3 repeat-containing protein [Halioglobus sp.]